MKKYLVYYSMKWQDVLLYRADMIIYAISQSILPILGLLVWLSLQGSGVKLQLNNIQLVQYFSFALIVTNLTASWKSWYLSEDIKNGNFSRYLVKPVSLAGEAFAEIFAQKTFRIVILVPTALVLGGFLIGWTNIYSGITLISFGYFLVSIVMAVVLSFFIDLLIGLSSVWFHEVDFLNGITGLLTILLSGKLIPIVFLPLWLHEINLYLPFRYLTSFPIEVLLNMVDGNALWLGLIVETFWTFILFGGYWILNSMVKKSYEGYGI